MARTIRHILKPILLAAVMLCVWSCYDYQNEREICDYTVQLRYDYNEENAPHGLNMIEYYVHTIDEYIFREDGILFMHNRVAPGRCASYPYSEITLPPGRYSVIAIGNRDERSEIWDEASGNAPVKDVTHRDDMRMALRKAEQRPSGTAGPSERLYHGYRTFTVKPQGISRVRVDVINAHLRIKFRVTWRNSAVAEKTDYYALLETVPSQYALMPELYYPAGSFTCAAHDPASSDGYPSASNDVIHHIPATCHAGSNPLRYRLEARINTDNEMHGEFLAYRIKRATRPLLHIRRTDNDAPLIENVDLQAYFDHYGYVVDESLRQEYEIDIIFDGNQILLLPMNLSDWDEGGTLKGS